MDCQCIRRISLWVGLLSVSFPLCGQENRLKSYDHFIRFENLSVNEGLSQSTGRDILQDSRGFMWIATQDGLNKYDGRKFTIYNNQSGDTNSLSDNFILSLHEDKEGNLWIGTNGSGIDRFNPELETFTHFRHQPSDTRSLSNDYINAIYEDSRGMLWFATYHGLNCLNPVTQEFTLYYMDSLSHQASHILCMLEDSRGQFWLGTNGGGLLQFDRQTGRILRQIVNHQGYQPIGGNTISCMLEDHLGNLWFGGAGCSLTRWNIQTDEIKVFHHDPADPSTISGNALYALYESQIGEPILWVGTVRNGLSRYMPKSQSFLNYSHDPNDPFSLPNNVIFSMESSEDGTMWVGTGGGGISKFSLRKNNFHPFRNPKGRLSNFIWSILEYDENHVLIGTQNSGVYLFDRMSQTFKPFQFARENPEASENFDIYTIYKDRQGAFWIGTYNAGVYQIHPRQNIYNHYDYIENSTNSLNASWVRGMFQESDSIMWIGTTNGLCRLNSHTGKISCYKPVPNDSTSLSHPDVLAILMDRYGYLWVGTYGGGLNRLDLKNQVFRQYLHSPDHPNSISNNRIRVLFEDPQGELWTGTDHGLNHYDRDKDQFTVITMKQGLPNNVIYSILPDKHGNFWMSTNRGICVYNPVDSSVTNYDVMDGLQSNEFNTGAYYLSTKGEMFFGGINGFNIFHPDSIRNNPYKPPVRITEISLYNKPIRPDQEGLLESCIATTDEIHLTYEQNFLSFEFAAFNYIRPEKNEYQYKMKGLDENWVYSGNRGYASYPDMKPGKYTFQVMGSNNDGLWNTAGDQVRLIISPPWWQSTLAFIIYALLGAALIFIYIRMRTYKLSHAKKELEKQVKMRTLEIANQKEEIESQRDSLEELNAAKDKLFAIIGHDLKSPLTSLLSLSHTLNEHLNHLTKEELKRAIANVDQSAQNLFKLLDNLLEWTKSQSGKSPILPRPFYLIDVIRENILYLSDTAQKKDITLNHNLDESILVYADKNMISTVIRNLISNAIKFTQRGGTIEVLSIQKEDEIIVEVKDNGRGMKEEDRDKLFRIDSTTSTKGTEDEKGSGLGLLLCKDFVEKNGGAIWADSQPGKGSTFAFTVPPASS